MTDERNAESGAAPGSSQHLDRRTAILAAVSLGVGFSSRAWGQTGTDQTKAPSTAQGRERAQLGQRARQPPHPPVEALAALYEIRGNFYDNKLTLSQAGTRLSGSYDDGTLVEGTVAGQRPNPVTVTFTRTLGDGTLQTYIGAASTQARGNLKSVQLAGVFYHNGLGPYPWNAAGTVGG